MPSSSSTSSRSSPTDSTSFSWKTTPSRSWRRRGRTISSSVREAERDEEQAGLVDVAVVAVDDVDLRLVRSNRRRSRFAVIVPPVPPPRITICFLAIPNTSFSRNLQLRMLAGLRLVKGGCPECRCGTSTALS